MKFIIKTMTFLRIIDQHDGQLSISNLAVLITLGKIAFAPTASLTEAGALFVALGNYAYKKHVNKGATSEDESSAIAAEVAATTQKLSEIESKVSGIAMSMGIKKLGT